MQLSSLWNSCLPRSSRDAKYAWKKLSNAHLAVVTAAAVIAVAGHQGPQADQDSPVMHARLTAAVIVAGKGQAAEIAVATRARDNPSTYNKNAPGFRGHFLFKQFEKY